MLQKTSIAASLLGFLVVGGLLFTNHPWLAIRLTNYFYFLLVLGAMGGFLDEIKK